MTEKERRDKAYRAWDNLKRRHNFSFSFIMFLSVVDLPPTKEHFLGKKDKNLSLMHITNIRWHPPVVYRKDIMKDKVVNASEFENTLNSIKQNLND